MTTNARKTYQHGNLPRALMRAVLELVNEHGVHGFSLAEAARRSQVSGSAPYRHYADRDALLAAVATEAYGELGQLLTLAKRRHRSPLAQLSAMATTYVRFARDKRASFEVLFQTGLDKSAYPALQAAGDSANREFLATVIALCGGNAAFAQELGVALRACAHGYAMLMIDGSLARDGLRDEDVPARAALTVRALAEASVATRRRKAGT